MRDVLGFGADGGVGCGFMEGDVVEECPVLGVGGGGRVVQAEHAEGAVGVG